MKNDKMPSRLSSAVGELYDDLKTYNGGQFILVVPVQNENVTEIYNFMMIDSKETAVHCAKMAYRRAKKLLEAKTQEPDENRDDTAPDGWDDTTEREE